MSRKSQFQNLTLERALQEVEDYARQPTIVQPAITLPIKPEKAVPLPPAWSFPTSAGQDSSLFIVSSTSEIVSSQPEVSEEGDELALAEEAPLAPAIARKKKLLRVVAVLLSALLVLAIYFTWHVTTPTSASPTVTQQAYSGAVNLQPTTGNSSSTTATDNSGGTIQVYIVGAIKRPGVYTLPADARVYQLVQAAGGTLPSADLVALNLAAKLIDGQEVYVLSVGETPPGGYTNNPLGSGNGGTPTVNSGQLVNINTASETEMRQVLHVSAATAQKIIAYRTQHGPYTSVDQLLQVISKSIYDRIKSMVTV